MFCFFFIFVIENKLGRHSVKNICLTFECHITRFSFFRTHKSTNYETVVPRNCIFFFFLIPYSTTQRVLTSARTRRYFETAVNKCNRPTLSRVRVLGYTRFGNELHIRFSGPTECRLCNGQNERRVRVGRAYADDRCPFCGRFINFQKVPKCVFKARSVRIPTISAVTITEYARATCYQRVAGAATHA